MPTSISKSRLKQKNGGRRRPNCNCRMEEKEETSSTSMPTSISKSRLMQKNRSKNGGRRRPNCNCRKEEEETSTSIVSKLPEELWREIGKRNQSRLDVSRFRSVCRTWRSSLPPPSIFPLQVPPPPGATINKFKNASYFISEVSFYAATATATRTMIVAFEEEYAGGKFSASAFLHKIQGHRTKLELPPVTKLKKLSFLSNAYHMHIGFPRTQVLKEGVVVRKLFNFFCNPDVLKLVIVSSYSSMFNPNYASMCDLKVVAHLLDRKLAVLSLAGGAMNNNWDTTNSTTFEDIVNYKGQVYAVDKLGATFIMDYNSLHMTQVAPAALPNFSPQINRGTRKVLHLSVVGDDLYMFCHEFETVPYPNLYKLSSRLGQWVEAHQDLPDHVFVKDVKCNFPVPKKLIPRHYHNGLLQVPRFCSWPDFVFLRIAVGFKNTYDPPFRHRYCDFPNLTYVSWEKLNKHCIR